MPPSHQLDNVVINIREEEVHDARRTERSRELIFGREIQAGTKKADSVFQNSDDICWRDVDTADSTLEDSKVMRVGRDLFSKVQDATNQRAIWAHQVIVRGSVYHHLPPKYNFPYVEVWRSSTGVWRM